MIKKTTGIATILLLILVIAIGITKASARTAHLHLNDLPDFDSKELKSFHLASKDFKALNKGLTLKDLKLLLLLDKSYKDDLSKGDLSAATKEVSKFDALHDLGLSKLASVKLKGHLEALGLEV